MKHIILILVLAGLCMVGSCDRKSDAARMADMKHCRKIEFGSTVITEPNKIERIISAMRRMTHYSEDYETSIFFSASMKATDRWGRTVTVDYAIGNVAVFFRKGESRELYTLLKEYGMMKPVELTGRPDPRPGDTRYRAYLHAMENSGRPVARIAKMKDCRKMEFAFQGDYAKATVIDDPNKIERIISAIRQRQHGDTVPYLFMLNSSMRATDSEGKTITVNYRVEDGWVTFQDAESRPFYALLKEYGVITPIKKFFGFGFGPGPEYLAYAHAMENSDRPIARIAKMKDCRKMEFAFQGDYAKATVIDDPTKIEWFISAIRRRRFYEMGQYSVIFSHSIRATDSEGKTITADYHWGDGWVAFRDAESKSFYTQLNEYGVMRTPEKPVPGPPPDILRWRVKRNPEPNEIN